jgi:HPt (histidine-containing phosphotransfer) domain-containing protein
VSASEPIDRSYLARFTLGNAALEREVLQLFADQLPRYLAQLRTPASPKDWKLALHSIKGSARGIGAQRLACVAQLAESLDLEADPEHRERLQRQAMDAVVAAAEEVCAHIACLFATP